MAQSTIVVYGLTGSNRRFIVPFEYLARRFVTVTLLGDTRTELVLNSDYRFIGLNEIETTAFHGGADGYDTIELRRETSATDRLVEFFDGSVLRSRDMNVSAIQTIHIAEEARNLAGDTLTVDDDGNLDARNRRMVNLAPAVDGKDAVNYNQVLTWSGSAFNQANIATTQAGIATTQAGTATTKAGTATTQANASIAARDRSEAARDRSEAARDRSEAARDRSEAAEIYAGSARDVAAGAAVAALASENAAAGSEVSAQKWAENPEDVAVTAGKFSAKHWALKAQQVSTIPLDILTQGDLLGATGQSTTKGMSQKAITDSLASAGSGGVPDQNGILYETLINANPIFRTLRCTYGSTGLTTLSSNSITYAPYAESEWEAFRFSKGPTGEKFINSSADLMGLSGGLQVDGGCAIAGLLFANNDITCLGILNVTDVNITSDRRKKKDIAPITDASNKVSQLSGNTYLLQEPTGFSPSAGILADELQKVEPSMVSTDSEGMLSVKYHGVIALLVEDSKEKEAKIRELQDSVAELLRRLK